MCQTSNFTYHNVIRLEFWPDFYQLENLFKKLSELSL